MDVEHLEAEAKATAAKHVANMLQRPDQLEKVEQYKRRVIRKKASVEAMLKTAMQSQLDGVKTGLSHLDTALSDIKEIKQNLRDIEDSFKEIPRLVEKLQDVREESLKHSQYAAAMENLKHIFNVPESVQKTQEWISDGKLLLAHQCLADLENSRDDLLFEMHKLPNQSPTDRNMLKQYFSDVEKLSEDLGKQLWLILRRTLNSVRKEPQVIVTALRIIEREERADEAAVARHQTTGFMPTGRPKRWKKRCFEILEMSVQDRIEGNQFEERLENKMWLVRHLEVTRQLILEDLKVVKTACVPCFPPSYYIVEKFVKMYHDSLSKHLQDIISNQLEGNEYITLLNWLNVYESSELMGHPDLMIDVKKYGPLLDNTIVENLICRYVSMLETNYQDWMKNTVMSDVKDWRNDSEPEADSEGYFHTSLPVIMFQMIDQHIQVAKTVNQELVERVLMVSIEQVVSVTRLYKEAIVEYKTKHFEDRSQLRYFTHYMIAIANNCLQFGELATRLRQRYWKSGSHDNEAEKIFQRAMTVFESLKMDILGYLEDELFLDLDKEINDLLTKKWMLSSTNIVDTICATVEDYCHDYTHLWPRNFDLLISGIQNRVAKGYITAILQKKLSLKNYEERKEVADKIVQEEKKLRETFCRANPLTIKRESPFDALPLLAEVLKLKDGSLLSLEISGLIKRYPDISADHLLALVTMRGDMGRADARQLVTEILPEVGSQRNAEVKSIFSQIQVG